MCLNPVIIEVQDPLQGRMFKQVGCGKCTECRQKRANEWATCMLAELQKVKQGCMITLTYDDLKIPRAWRALDHTYNLCKKDLQDFNKRLRKAIKVPIKYFGCGEYGGQYNRPHFHEVILGWQPVDCKIIGKSEKGYDISQSALIEQVWKYGRTTITELTPDTCSYCALYCTPVGRELGRLPEFNVMSRNIGNEVLLAEIADCIQTDQWWYLGQSRHLPQRIIDKYCKPIMRKEYDVVLKKHREVRSGWRENNEVYKLLKAQRAEQAYVAWLENDHKKVYPECQKEYKNRRKKLGNLDKNV